MSPVAPKDLTGLKALPMINMEYYLYNIEDFFKVELKTSKHVVFTAKS